MKKEIKPRKILFVCTGNIFRSMSAKHCLEDYIKRNNIKDIIVNSAGTVAKKEKIENIPVIIDELKSLGIDASKHKQKKLTKKDLDENDIVIVMGKDHVEFINRKFNFDESILFNEIIHGKKTSLLDVWEVVPEWRANKKGSEKYIRETIRYIHKSIPKLYKNLDKYLLFLDFISGRKTQKYGFPFMPLYETKNTLSFMSISIPQKEDGHILVIPKRRYSHFDNIPKNIKEEIFLSVSKICKATRKAYGGHNIILNNGHDAGQYIFHSHFHIIPRNKGDCIKIELWKNMKLTQDKFISLNKKIKELIEK